MIDIDKEYRTRDGREVRIYATDGCDPHSVHGAFLSDGEWHLTGWKSDGKVVCSGKNASRSIDLIEVKPRIKETVWINIYNNYWSISSTEKFAKDKADCGILARLKVDIDVEEGHGL